VLTVILEGGRGERRILARLSVAYAARGEWQDFSVDPRDLGCGRGVLLVEANLGPDEPTTFRIDDLRLEVAVERRVRETTSKPR
jgi:hypothetical protein